MRTISLLALAFLSSCTQPVSVGRLHQGSYINEEVGPATLASGNNNNWSAGSCNAQDGICRIVGDAGGSTITGLDSSVYGDRNVGLWFWNEGTTPIVFANMSSSSTSGNRMHLRAAEDLILPHGYGVLFTALADWTTDPYTPMGWFEFGFHAYDSISTSTPSRSLGTAFRPSTARPTMVTYSASADCTITLTGGQEGRVEILSDSANPPTTLHLERGIGVPGPRFGFVLVDRLERKRFLGVEVLLPFPLIHLTFGIRADLRDPRGLHVVAGEDDEMAHDGSKPPSRRADINMRIASFQPEANAMRPLLGSNPGDSGQPEDWNSRTADCIR
jgi:hypothetical protein